jgi:hypothetical protein
MTKFTVYTKFTVFTDSSGQSVNVSSGGGGGYAGTLVDETSPAIVEWRSLRNLDSSLPSVSNAVFSQVDNDFDYANQSRYNFQDDFEMYKDTTGLNDGIYTTSGSGLSFTSNSNGKSVIKLGTSAGSITTTSRVFNNLSTNPTVFHAMVQLDGYGNGLGGGTIQIGLSNVAGNKYALFSHSDGSTYWIFTYTDGTYTHSTSLNAAVFDITAVHDFEIRFLPALGGESAYLVVIVDGIVLINGDPDVEAKYIDSGMTGLKPLFKLTGNWSGNATLSGWGWKGSRV